MIEHGMFVVCFSGLAARTEARAHSVLVPTSEGLALERRQFFDIRARQVRDHHALMAIVQLRDAHGHEHSTALGLANIIVQLNGR